MIGPVFIGMAVRAGLRVPEVAELLDATLFRGSYSVEKTVLADVPVWLRLILVKGA